MNVRLQGLVDIFPRDNVLVDIGADHGLLGIELLRLGKTNKVVNVDLSKDALKRSAFTYRRAGYLTKAIFVYGDGFTNLSNWSSNCVAVIAGLGSVQILNILQRVPLDLRHLILMSHTDYYEIRKWASRSDWHIKKEKYIKDNKGFVYLILDLVRSSNIISYTQEEYIFGRREFWENNMDLFKDYWIRKAKRIKKIPKEYRDSLEKETLKFLEEKDLWQ